MLNEENKIKSSHNPTIIILIIIIVFLVIAFGLYYTYQLKQVEQPKVASREPCPLCENVNKKNEEISRLQVENNELWSKVSLLGAEKIYSANPFYCMSGHEFSEEGIRDRLLRVKHVDEKVVDGFFVNPEIKELMKTSKFHQFCYKGRGEISFVMLSNEMIKSDSGSKGSNNTIGNYVLREEEKLVTDMKFVPKSGDVGLCAIDGYIERNPIYSCGGGDGPGGWNRVYVLNRESGESLTIKDCATHYDYENDDGYDDWCEVNLLNLGEHPF